VTGNDVEVVRAGPDDRERLHGKHVTEHQLAHDL